MSRFEIRAREASEVAKSYGIDGPTYVVWDLELNKAIPFGNYRSRDHAEARVQRETAKRL